jgi:hypothetical protein
MAVEILPRRGGSAPLTAGPGPSEQLTQNAPAVLQAMLSRRVLALPGVWSGAAGSCVSGSQSWRLLPSIGRGPPTAFITDTEFAHAHPPYDGSMHLMLSTSLASAAIAAGWGERNWASDAVLIYGPRDQGELTVIWHLVRCSYLSAAQGG